MSEASNIYVRSTEERDFDGIIQICALVYPNTPSWSREQLASHLRVFPEGQLVAVEEGTERIVGMAASLIIQWDDYDDIDNWRDFTDHGFFTNHDPEYGRTLYGAEVMVHPEMQRHGIGTLLYTARRELVERLGLLRIRAGARLRGFHRYRDRMTPEEYVAKVIEGAIVDPTLTFQIRQGFVVLDVVSNYLKNDPESAGYAALIEWINEKVAREEDYKGRPVRFQGGKGLNSPRPESNS